MAGIDSPTKPLTFAFSYGFLGGPLNSRQLRKALRKAGYTEAPLKQADIIIAHSAGCWLIPEAAGPKLVVYVGMPLSEAFPHETFKDARQKNIQAFFHNFHLLRGLALGVYSLYYWLAQPVRNREIVRQAKQAPDVTSPSVNTVFIANRDDPWPHSARLKKYLSDNDWAFLSLTGSHNDIWEYPERYAAIISHYARLLAKTDAR
jgi:hypothetical protein